MMRVSSEHVCRPPFWACFYAAIFYRCCHLGWPRVNLWLAVRAPEWCFLWPVGVRHVSKESAKSCRRLEEWGGQLLGPFPGRWRYFEKKEAGSWRQERSVSCRRRGRYFFTRGDFLELFMLVWEIFVGGVSVEGQQASCRGAFFGWEGKLLQGGASCSKGGVCFLCCGEEVLKLFGDCWRSSFLRGDAELSGDQRRNSEL